MFFLLNFVAFSCFFSFLAFLHKNTEKHIATNVWSVKHPNPGQNVQHCYIGLIIRWGSVKKPAGNLFRNATIIMRFNMRNCPAKWDFELLFTSKASTIAKAYLKKRQMKLVRPDAIWFIPLGAKRVGR